MSSSGDEYLKTQYPEAIRPNEDHSCKFVAALQSISLVGCGTSYMKKRLHNFPIWPYYFSTLASKSVAGLCASVNTACRKIAVQALGDQPKNEPVT